MTRNELETQIHETIEFCNYKWNDFKIEYPVDFCGCEKCIFPDDKVVDVGFVTCYYKEAKQFFSVGVWADGRVYFAELLDIIDLDDFCKEFFKREIEAQEEK